MRIKMESISVMLTCVKRILHNEFHNRDVFEPSSLSLGKRISLRVPAPACYAHYQRNAADLCSDRRMSDVNMSDMFQWLVTDLTSAYRHVS